MPAKMFENGTIHMSANYQIILNNKYYNERIAVAPTPKHANWKRGLHSHKLWCENAQLMA